MVNIATHPSIGRRAGIPKRRLYAGWRLLYALIVVFLFAPVGVVALGSAFGLIALPFEMHVLAERMPVVFRIHMAASAAALLLIPVVIACRHSSERHRMLGRVLGGFVVVGGLTAFPVAIFSHSSEIARAGFFAQAVVWLVLFALGFAAIRARQRDRHRVLMLAMVAVTTGAVWFRLMIGTAIALGLPFDAIYAASAWMAWIIPLALSLLYRKALADFLR
jgi:hypothetical protein